MYEFVIVHFGNIIIVTFFLLISNNRYMYFKHKLVYLNS